MMQTLEQIRAKFAWERVQGQTREYKNLVKSLPAMVMTNGLMQTLAFLKAKGKEENSAHRVLLKHIQDWFKEQGIIKIIDGDDFSTTIQRLYNLEPAEYQRATEEAMGILKWLRQFADAAIEGR